MIPGPQQRDVKLINCPLENFDNEKTSRSAKWWAIICAFYLNRRDDEVVSSYFT